MILGERIKVLIKNHGYSATQMAEKIGITNPYIYKIFKMESVDTKYLNKIADVLKVPVQIFFMDDKLEENANPDLSGPVLDISEYLKETIKAQSKLIKQLEENIDNLKNIVHKFDSITHINLEEFKSIVSKEEYEFLSSRKGNK